MSTLDINNGRIVLSPKPGRTLLTALTEGKIFVPSACGGHGKCGLCAIKILRGAENPLTEAEKTHLTPENQQTGFRLSCQIKTDTDLFIEIPDEYFSIKRFSGKLLSKTPMTRDILRLTIGFLPNQFMDYKPGQYIQLRSPAYNNSPPVMRAYSLASIPEQKSTIELFIRKVENGICTTWVFDHLKEGDLVQFSGPYGKFCLTCSQAPMVMIAGGSGMAPILGLLREMRKKKVQRKAVFFFGAQTQKDLFMLDELADITKALPNFSFVPVLSGEPNGKGWAGETGLVTEAASRHLGRLSKHEAFLCGSPGMISSCVKMLTDKGLPENRIYYDKF